MSKKMIEITGVDDWALFFSPEKDEESQGVGTASILLQEKGSDSFRKIELPDDVSMRLLFRTFSIEFLKGNIMKGEFMNRSRNFASDILTSLGIEVKKVIIMELSDGVSALIFYDGSDGEEKKVIMEIEELLDFVLNCPKTSGFRLFVGQELMDSLPESREGPGDECVFRIPVRIQGDR